MKAKNFKDYLAERLSQEEIAEIEKQAEKEFEAIPSLQSDKSPAIAERTR